MPDNGVHDADADIDADAAAFDMLELLENVTKAEYGADETVFVTDEEAFAAPDLDALFDGNSEDESDAGAEEAIDSQPQNLSCFERVKQFFKRGGKAQEDADDDTLKTYIGLKMCEAFERQTSKSPLGVTLLLVLCLLLVAAFPPIINLAYIQPNITENNQKLSQIANFKAQIEVKKRDSAIQLNKIKKLEKTLGAMRRM